MEEKQKQTSFMSNMSPQQTFIFGIVAGILVLCTIGFFILLSVTFGGDDAKSVKNIKTVDTNNIVATDVEGPEQFSQCLDSGKYANTVSQDFQLGASLGVNGTPATFINGYLVSGALPYEAVKQVVDTLLAGKTPDFDFMKDQQTGKIVKVDMPELPDAVWLGKDNAKITMVEFSDFECPYCNRFEPTVKQVLQNYPDDVKFTYRHFPLSFHQNAQKAAEAYECAKEQGSAFEMHDALFELARASNMSVNSYKQVANQLELK